MQVLFYNFDYKVVGILREDDRSIAVVDFETAKRYLGESSLDNLKTENLLTEEVKEIVVNDYSYFFNLHNKTITVYRGEYGKSSSHKLYYIDTPLGKVKCIIHKYESKFKIDFYEEDDTNDNHFETSEDTKFISDCEKCKGKGYYLVNGLEVACDCYKKLKTHTKNTDKPIEIENATKINCCDIGLVPEEFRDTEFNSDNIVNNLLKIGSSLDGFRLVNIDRFMKALNSILMACKTGSKLNHSYLLACDKGFGKLEFVYDCLKYLYKRNQTCCKFISLQELGNLRAEYVKKSQAIVNCGYYYKDNDRELLQRTIEEDGKQIIRSLLTSNKEIDSKLALLQDSLLNKIYAKANVKDRNLYESKDKLVNTWEDYIEYPLVFVYFSGSLDRHYETEVLQSLLNIRGTKALPTICFIESSLGIFKDEPTYFDDNRGGTIIDISKTKSYYWLNMLSSESSLYASNIDSVSQDNEITSVVEYDRLVYINSYIDYKNRIKLGE